MCTETLMIIIGFKLDQNKVFFFMWTAWCEGNTSSKLKIKLDRKRWSGPLIIHLIEKPFNRIGYFTFLRMFSMLLLSDDRYAILKWPLHSTTVNSCRTILLLQSLLWTFNHSPLVDPFGKQNRQHGSGMVWFYTFTCSACLKVDGFFPAVA